MSRLLIVDDNQENLYMLQVLLSANGFQVQRASNGAEALERARHAPPDMIVSDILMPVMDGFALCRAWKADERLKNIPFVFYTATYTDPKDEHFGLSLGADRFVIKPVEPDKLLALLRETLKNCAADKPVALRRPVEEAQYYKEYNAALIRKLEDKMLQLEDANRTLQRDIAEIKRAEEERQKLQDQVIQAQKMESVGRLAGGIAHDSNNMLGVILGFAEMTLSKLDPTHPVYANIKQIQTAAQHSAALTQQLLAFARRQPASPKVLDLNDTMAGMLKILQRLIGEDIELVWKPGAGLWPVKMDPSQVDQILANLCVNARDAIAGAGRVVIETDNVVFDAASCRELEGPTPGEYVRLSVRDNGCGMDKETLTHLFEPFFTTKGVGKGTGLGLATVYGIVKQNEGHISVQSEPNHGATFEIYLPRHSAGAEQDRTAVPEVSAAHDQETVLLVEDEPQLMNLTRMMLESLGYQVLSAVTPGEAIRLAQEHAGEIHLLMTDFVMPEMNGKDLSEEIQKRHPQVKSLFMSGYTTDAIGTKGFLEEGVHFLQKPYSSNELAVKVREVLDREET
jgi:signal transduction histidine kinase